MGPGTLHTEEPVHRGSVYAQMPVPWDPLPEQTILPDPVALPKHASLRGSAAE